jgi:predicted DCC family thiol-disulfide oxidoreductase YuxK
LIEDPADIEGSRRQMDRLYVLYDSRCGFCSWAKRWLLRQPTLIDLEFIPAGSPLAARLFPGLGRHGNPPEELVVVSDQGGVYRDSSAWIMCLFALEEYREWANRLAHPVLRPLACRAFSVLSRHRRTVSRWLSMAGDVEMARILGRFEEPACLLPAPSPASMMRPQLVDASTGHHEVIVRLDKPVTGGS